jgi:hypothetical protein
MYSYFIDEEMMRIGRRLKTKKKIIFYKPKPGRKNSTFPQFGQQ